MNAVDRASAARGDSTTMRSAGAAPPSPVRSMSPRRKIIKALGGRAGLPELHPHAFRHASGVELHRRTGGNLRVVQEHLRHADIQTTTVYTRVTQHELQQVVSVFDKPGS